MSQFIEMFGTSESNEKGWKICSFGEKFSITSGGTPNTQIEEYWNGNISWIGSNCCQNCILTENDGKYITEEGFNHCSAKMYKPDTILVALVGATIGKVAYLKFDTCTNQNVAGIEIKNRTEFEPMFIYYLLQNMYQRFFMLGMGKFKMASLGFIKSLPLMIPPMELQQRFVSIAEQADKSGFVGVKSQFIEMFQEAPRIELGKMASFINGSAFKPEEWSSDGLPIVRIQNLTQDDSPYNYYNGDTTKKIVIDNGDILVSWSATLGVFLWSKGKALLNQHIFKVSFDKLDVNKDFFVYAVKLALDKMSEVAHGSTMRHVVKKDFNETIVANPSINDQESFALIAKQADKSGYYN